MSCMPQRSRRGNYQKWQVYKISTFEKMFKGAFFMLIFRKGGDGVAVKVIRYGEKRRIICNICGSLLEYEKEDIKTVQTGMNEYEKEIVCPNCSEVIRVKGAERE